MSNDFKFRLSFVSKTEIYLQRMIRIILNSSSMFVFTESVYLIKPGRNFTSRKQMLVESYQSFMGDQSIKNNLINNFDFNCINSFAIISK